MAYNKFSLAYEIATLYPKYPPNLRTWLFAPKPEDFRVALQEYCWIIYQKTNTDAGFQIIGREWDTDPYSLDANILGRAIGGYDKQASGKWTARPEGAPVGGLNTSPGARGNVLKMDRWHPTMNDCWVLGGIHRGATFKLVSPRIPANIWNPMGFPVVTAREILGLLHYGYETQRVGSDVQFVPRDRGVAQRSNITDYWDFMVEKSRQGAGLVRELLDKELKANLHAELLAFDRSKLRKVA
jgi:hypothetical protein